MIKFFCENCGRKMGVPETLAGKRGKCPGCGEFIVVPKSSPVVPPAKAPSHTPTDYEMRAIEPAVPAPAPKSGVSWRRPSRRVSLAVVAGVLVVGLLVYAGVTNGRHSSGDPQQTGSIDGQKVAPATPTPSTGRSQASVPPVTRPSAPKSDETAKYDAQGRELEARRDMEQARALLAKGEPVEAIQFLTAAEATYAHLKAEIAPVREQVGRECLNRAKALVANGEHEGIRGLLDSAKTACPSLAAEAEQVWADERARESYAALDEKWKAASEATDIMRAYAQVSTDLQRDEFKKQAKGQLVRGKGRVKEIMEDTVFGDIKDRFEVRVDLGLHEVYALVYMPLSDRATWAKVSRGDNVWFLGKIYRIEDALGWTNLSVDPMTAGPGNGPQPAPVAAPERSAQGGAHVVTWPLIWTSSGKDPLWDAEMEAGSAAYDRRDFAESERQFARAVRESKAIADSMSFTALSLAGLGEAQRAEGKNKEAEGNLRRALGVRQAKKDPEDLGVTFCQYSLGLLYEGTGRIGHAELALRQAVAGMEASLKGCSNEELGAAFLGGAFHDSPLGGLMQKGTEQLAQEAEERRQQYSSMKEAMLLDLSRVLEEKERESPEAVAKEAEEDAKAEESVQAEEKAHALLVTAQGFAVNKLRQKAIPLLNEILQKYPGTDAASSAKEWLAALQDPKGVLPSTTNDPTKAENGSGGVEPASALCPACGGAKGFKCTACETGQVTTDCPACHGRGNIACARCKGKGYYPCDCGGKNFNCPNCKGSGEIKCDKCDGQGRPECKRCNGTGRITGPCSVCKGKRWVPCKDCHGTGVAQTATSVAEEKAAALLNVAKGFETNKDTELAIERYEKLIRAYPGTKAATEAISRLATLKPEK